MKILKYSLGQMQANCYFLINGQNCLIIDPADDASFILEELQRRHLNLLAMMATHGHFDHVGAVGEIQMSLDVPLYICKEDQFLLERLGETAKHFLGFDPNFIKPITVKYLTERKFKIQNLELNIIFTPGHTPGSSCFYLEKENVLFTGDTLFKNAVGRTDLSYSNKDDLKESIKKIFELPEGTVVYPGHEEETILQDEKDIFLNVTT